MEEFNLDESFFENASSGSQGSQLKYKYENKWFKIDTCGYESDSEVLACIFLESSNYRDFVKYHRCIINGRTGCYSENFLNAEEQLVTFERVYYQNTGKSLTNEILLMNDICERIDFVKYTIQQYTGLCVEDYVDTCLSLDYITRNGDRHFNNMAVIRTKNGYRNAPIFDNGDAFFSNYQKFEPWLNLEECLNKCVAKPFSGSFDIQFSCIRNPLKIKYSVARERLQAQPDGRGKQAALYLLDVFKKEFCDF